MERLLGIIVGDVAKKVVYLQTNIASELGTQMRRFREIIAGDDGKKVVTQIKIGSGSGIQVRIFREIIVGDDGKEVVTL